MTEKTKKVTPKVTPKVMLQRVSITFQGTDQQRERLRKEAFDMGHRRMDNTRRTEIGEVSPLIVRMIEFVFAHWEEFKAWKGNGTA